MFRYIFFLLIFISSLHANQLSLNDNQNSYNNFKLSYIKDSTDKFTIEEVSKKNFNNKTKNSFSLGYTKGSFWFKFSVKNLSSKKEFVLNLHENFYEVADLYYYDGKNWIKNSISMYDHILKRDIKSHNLAFDISIPKNSERVYYLKLKGKYAYFGNIVLNEKSYYYFSNFTGVDTFFMFLYGVLFIIIVFTLFLYISTKEKIYLYYLGFVFFNSVYYVKINGFLVYLDLQKYIYELQLSAGFMLAFLTLFSKEYLETKKYLKKTDSFLNITAFIFFTLGVLIVFSYQPWNMFINNLAGLLNIFLIVVSIIIYFKSKNKTTKYYTIAMLIYFSFIVAFTFMVNGTLEYSSITRYGFIFASVIEVAVFSFILANRYNEMKKNTQKYLEKEVKNRTKDLNTLLKERETLLKEVHHRVKNNFHMLIGLLWMEEKKDTSNNTKLEDIRNRIKAMSIIHEKLYATKDIKNISVKEYISEIINNLLASNKVKNKHIDINIDNITLEFDQAVSLGIIVNEIINNSLKHNLDLNSLNISISLFNDKDNLKLLIEDNGKGFDKTISNKNGLGMVLIESFSKKLFNSKYDFLIDNGVLFRLTFSKDKNE